MVDALLQLVPSWQFALDGGSIWCEDQIPDQRTALACLSGVLFGRLSPRALAGARQKLDADLGAFLISFHITFGHVPADPSRLSTSLHRVVSLGGPAFFSHC